MDSDVSEVAETDAQVLMLDIPDDALERAAGATPLITLDFALSIGPLQCLVPRLRDGDATALQSKQQTD